MARTVVYRTDLGAVLTTSGQTESADNTIISCQLERLDFRTSGGAGMSTGGASVIIDVVDEGTMVKKDDVICRLDASDYEELVRQQEIKVDQARAALLQTQLDFEVAELGVREYTEGLLKQSMENLSGQIVFDQSNLERTVDRLAWTTRMLEKGYASLSQRTTAERAVTQANLKLIASKWQMHLFERFGRPKSLKSLQANVEKCRYGLISNERRLTRMTERLDYYKQMVDFCTIRAPHDGFLIYASDPYRSGNYRLEPGATVRQSQKLFFLPNLDQMNLLTYLHESVAQRVQAGMVVRAKIEGLGARTLTGRVLSVAPLPVAASSGWLSSGEVKYFIGVVKLDESPPGMRPGLTAQVEIDIDRREDVLAIPSEALAIRDGREVCYVAGQDGLERRSITIGQSTKDFLEVTSGLNEGEEVVMQPEQIDSLDSMVAASDEPEPASALAESTGFSGTPTVE
ncbi:efflux RND transporter periplasmic adaptor subunit [Tundrisphaera sp. TA3]|uniref:efflux RND transporter periplasmic adaptor subunit n=1 Tax=Tundrisphaera sp. TA3 TaxID=3435775 RepID=UPI003EBF3660